MSDPPSDQPDTRVFSLNPTGRFSDRVTYYVQSRPKYPRAVLQFCRDNLGLLPQHAIADIGSGTGFLTELFLDNGNVVYAVEPNAPMRQAGEQLLGSNPNFKSINATAEATTLESTSVNFIIAGQAFHWFDPPRARKEFNRILVPGGWVVLVWNERHPTQNDFNADYDKIVHEFQSGDSKVDHHQHVTRENSTILPEFFAPSSFQSVTFDNMQELDRPGLHARVLSSSYLPLPGHPRCPEMLKRLDQAFDTHQHHNRIQIPYDTKVYYGRLD